MGYRTPHPVTAAVAQDCCRSLLERTIRLDVFFFPESGKQTASVGEGGESWRFGQYCQPRGGQGGGWVDVGGREGRLLWGAKGVFGRQCSYRGLKGAA